MAGWRLQKVLGGAFGHIAIDPGWFAYFTRCNEVVVVATYRASADVVSVVHTAESVKLAIIDAVGGKVSDVTLVGLSRVNAALHLSLRRVISGFSKLSGISHAKFDLLSAQLCPDPPSDDKTLVALRAANDITNNQLVSQLHAYIIQQGNRNDNFSESIRNIKAPSSCFPPDTAKNVRMALFAADADLSLSLCARPNSALTHLLPEASVLSKLCSNDLVLPGLNFLEGKLETPYYSDFVDIDVHDGELHRDRWDGASKGEIKDIMPLRVAQSPFAAEANEFFTTSVTASIFEDIVPSTYIPIPIRIAARVNETVTYVSDAKVEWSQVDDSGKNKDEAARMASQISGIIQLRYVYVSSLSREIQEQGHCPIPFVLEWDSPYPLESVTMLVPGQIPLELKLPEHTGGKHRIALPLVLPALQPNKNLASLGSIELLNIEYKYNTQYLPSILRAQANARYTLAKSTEPSQPLHHQFVDIAVRTLLSQQITGTPSQVQFMVQVPDIPTDTDADGTAITKVGNPMMKPTGSWIGDRKQILWSLSELAAKPDGAPSNIATIDSHFRPGKPIELIARIPVHNGIHVSPIEASEFSSTRPCMLQARFQLINGSAVPVSLRIKPVSPAFLDKGKQNASDGVSTDYQLEIQDEKVMNRYFSVQVEELLSKSFSTVKTQFRLQA